MLSKKNFSAGEKRIAGREELMFGVHRNWPRLSLCRHRGVRDLPPAYWKMRILRFCLQGRGAGPALWAAHPSHHTWVQPELGKTSLLQLVVNSLPAAINSCKEFITRNHRTVSFWWNTGEKLLCACPRGTAPGLGSTTEAQPSGPEAKKAPWAQSSFGNITAAFAQLPCHSQGVTFVQAHTAWGSAWASPDPWGKSWRGLCQGDCCQRFSPIITKDKMLNNGIDLKRESKI